MTHSTIFIKNLCLSFANKNCFVDFSCQVYFGSRIAIVGRNGSGKSSLLKILQGMIVPNSGAIIIPNDVIFGYVPQIIDDYSNLSGGERLNKAVSAALAKSPNVLLLDEPTNHLTGKNRASLLRMLQNYYGTIILVSHDLDLLCNHIDTIWHIDNDKITIFSGSYHDYFDEIKTKRQIIEHEIAFLKKEKKQVHADLMQEQKRAAKSRVNGEKSISQHKWPTIVSKAKAKRAEQTSGKKKTAINNRKTELVDTLENLYLPEIIIPKFNLISANFNSGALVTINSATAGYVVDQPFLTNINLILCVKEKIAIIGDNGAGKSTLVKAILNYENIFKTGDWYMPNIKEIGYLDQHYGGIELENSVFEMLQNLAPNWTYLQIRQHLKDFLFRTNEEVNNLGKFLSGGERARLSLAMIAASTPKLLILDEITNNLDLETKAHVIQVLRDYPGAIIAISHDESFLQEIDITDFYTINNGTILRRKQNDLL